MSSSYKSTGGSGKLTDTTGEKYNDSLSKTQTTDIKKPQNITTESTNEYVDKMITNILSNFPESSMELEKQDNSNDQQLTVTKPSMLKHEIPMFVPKVEIHHVIREVPVIDVEYIEKTVQVPKIEYVDVYEEVEKIEYVKKEVEYPNIIQVPKEVIKHVPQIVTQYVDRIVHVQSKTEVYRGVPYPIESQFIVPRFQDRSVVVPISVEVQPEIYESRDIYQVNVARYCPKLVPVDVFVPKPVHIAVKDLGILGSEEVPAHDVDIKLLQKLTIEMNPHLYAAQEYNTSQYYKFLDIIEKGREVSMQYNVEPFESVTSPIVDMSGSPISTEKSQYLIEDYIKYRYFQGLPGFTESDYSSSESFAKCDSFKSQTQKKDSIKDKSYIQSQSLSHKIPTQNIVLSVE